MLYEVWVGISKVPSHCVCDASFNADHAMICRHGGLTFIHHNEPRNLIASWLHEVCHDVVVEPCHSLARPLFRHLLITGMILGQISMLEGFGVDDRVHFLI